MHIARRFHIRVLDQDYPLMRSDGDGAVQEGRGGQVTLKKLPMNLF